MCEQLEVSEQGYYQWRKRLPSDHDDYDELLIAMIRKFHMELKGNPGRRRIWAELRAHGYRVSLKRVHRLMKAIGLVGRHPRKWRKTTIHDGSSFFPKDLLCRNFTADKPNEKWVGDITYIWTWQGWAYLATVIDLNSRKVVGWALADHMRADLAIDALKMALTHRKPPKGVIFHSDRGSQYTSTDFAKFCKDNGVTRSMGRTGICYDNAAAESFFASYKKELIFTKPWRTIKELKTATFEWIETYYNRKRRHAAIAYLTPAEYELGYKSLDEVYAAIA